MSSTEQNDTPEEETVVLDEKQGSIIMGLISQLRKGSDLSKITLPTFILEPRSLLGKFLSFQFDLERLSDFMSHPEFISETHKKTDSLERFVDIVRYFLSGFHIRPQGVKKPYNPVLGEFFRCSWTFNDNTKGFYFSEQVTHHPPVSAWMYSSPSNCVLMSSEVRPKSKFLGNSAATIMEGGIKIRLTNLDEDYLLSMPNAYARGILFGTMYMELGDNVVIRCPKNDLICELEFKVKGFFTGTYNGIGGKIKKESTGEVLYTLSGKWAEVVQISKGKSKVQETLFDVSQIKAHPKIIVPESEQEEFESRKLWSKVTHGIQIRNMDLATQEKTMIENNQRKLKASRETDETEWKPRFFENDDDEGWKFKVKIPADPTEALNVLEEQLYSKADNPLHSKFWVEEKK